MIFRRKLIFIRPHRYRHQTHSSVFHINKFWNFSFSDSGEISVAFYLIYFRLVSDLWLLHCGTVRVARFHSITLSNYYLDFNASKGQTWYTFKRNIFWKTKLCQYIYNRITIQIPSPIVSLQLIRILKYNTDYLADGFFVHNYPILINSRAARVSNLLIFSVRDSSLRGWLSTCALSAFYLLNFSRQWLRKSMFARQKSRLTLPASIAI